MIVAVVAQADLSGWSPSPAEAQVESCSGRSELLIHGGRQGRGRGGPLGILLPWTWVPGLGRSRRGLCPPGASGPGCGQTCGRTMPHLGVRGTLRAQVGPSFTPGGSSLEREGMLRPGSGRSGGSKLGGRWPAGSWVCLGAQGRPTPPPSLAPGPGGHTEGCWGCSLSLGDRTSSSPRRGGCRQ